MYIFTLLEKDDVVSALVAFGSEGNGFRVANYCGRTHTMRYGDAWYRESSAREEFEEVLAKTVERGWKIIYYGPPKFG